MTTAPPAGSDGPASRVAAEPAPSVPEPRRSRVSRTTAVILALVVIALGVAADQASKRWAVDALGDGHSIPLFPTARFALVFNPGVSFGLGAEFGPPLAVGICLLALGLAGWVGWQIRHRAPLLSVLLLSAVLAGAIGNLLDRFTRADDGPLSGHVVDFIAVEWFAVFNVADILTVCGMIAWACTMVFGHRDEDRAAAEATAAPDPAAPDAAPDAAADAPPGPADRA